MMAVRRQGTQRVSRPFFPWEFAVHLPKSSFQSSASTPLELRNLTIFVESVHSIYRCYQPQPPWDSDQQDSSWYWPEDEQKRQPRSRIRSQERVPMTCVGRSSPQYSCSVRLGMFLSCNLRDGTEPCGLSEMKGLLSMNGVSAGLCTEAMTHLAGLHNKRDGLRSLALRTEFLFAIYNINQLVV